MLSKRTTFRRAAATIPILGALLLTGCWHQGDTAPAEQAASPAASTSPVRFREVAAESGVVYEWKPLGKRPLNILQTIGNGAAFLDFDNDGNLDILLVGPKPALYKGDGHGRFTDVSAGVLGDLHGYFLGVATGDIDNDGFVDIYLSGYREGRLLRNDHGARFVDITGSSGLKPQPWGTACGFADLNGDGFLDLYVGNYADFSSSTVPQLCKFRTQSHGDVESSCGPTRYNPLHGVVYQSVAGKRFTDISAQSGFATQNGRNLGVAFADLHGKGEMSVALANDEAPGDLFVARGGAKRENTGEASGVATDGEGKVHGGMGVDWGDYDNDGRFDLFVATFRNEIKNLYRNEGDESFTDRSYAAGVGQPALPYVAFGAKFFDADNDGWLDLLIANGHVQDNIDLIEDTTYRQPLLFLRNQNASFTDESGSSGIAATGKIVGRGLAVGDYDNDGKMDALVVDSEGKPLLLHNETPTAAESWAGFVCKDKNGRDAIGATLTLQLAGGKKLVRQCQTAGSYLSASDPRVHFGLGAPPARIESLIVRWPDGKTQIVKDIQSGRYQTIVQR